MLKKIEISDPNSCLNKAADNEPIFVIRAQDQFAATLVRVWAELVASSSKGYESHKKVFEARKIAKEMELWPHKKIPD